MMATKKQLRDAGALLVAEAEERLANIQAEVEAARQRVDHAKNSLDEVRGREYEASCLLTYARRVAASIT